MSEEQKDTEDAPEVSDPVENEVEEEVKPKLPLRGRRVLEEKIVHVSCRARKGCEGNSAMMTTDPRDRKWVRYRCGECNGSWTIATGGSFSM